MSFRPFWDEQKLSVRETPYPEAQSWPSILLYTLAEHRWMMVAATVHPSISCFLLGFFVLLLRVVHNCD